MYRRTPLARRAAAMFALAAGLSGMANAGLMNAGDDLLVAGFAQYGGVRLGLRRIICHHPYGHF
jgi:hypothetical protein